MNMRLETFPPYHIAYMRRTGAYGDGNYQLMARLKDWARDNGLWNDTMTIFGIARDNPGVTAPEQCRYDVCLLVPAGFEADGISKGVLDSGRYAVFTVDHTSEAVQRFYADFIAELAAAGLAFDASRPMIERYVNKLVESGFCEFCVPVAE